MILIRADANMEIGSGHVMRCLSIAKELLKFKQEVEFVTADHHADNLIEKSGFKVTCLNTKWNEMEDEISELKKIMIEKNCKIVIVDSYYVTKKYLEQLNGLVKVVVFDDLNQFIYPVDIIINYNIYSSQSFYEPAGTIKTKFLLGSKYTPLREEFIGNRREIYNHVTNVLITTGGADIFNVAGQIIEVIKLRQEYKNIRFHVIVGPYNKNKVLLEDLVKDDKNFILHQNVTLMSKLMTYCDVAISAGGSALYELCSCGTPTISFSYADNQIPGVNEFNSRNLIKYAGDIRENTETCLENILIYLDKLCKDTMLRKKLSHRMNDVVDGYGTRRISEEVLILLR